MRSQADTERDARLAVALVGLSADLITTGFFRFGRFTSRGYGWVRLEAPDRPSAWPWQTCCRRVQTAGRMPKAAQVWPLLCWAGMPRAVLSEAVQEWYGG